MDKIDFVELATFCVNKHRDEINSSGRRYEGTLFVSISEDDEIKTSTTPHILRDAYRCILIHERSEVAVTNWYSWYKVEYINEEGCVFDSIIDEHFSISIRSWGAFSNQVMSLDYDDCHIYWSHRPFAIKIGNLWSLYTKVKDIKSESEIKLVASLFMKDEKIFELEKKIEDFSFSEQLLKDERNQYESMLIEIKKLIENKS